MTIIKSIGLYIFAIGLFLVGITHFIYDLSYVQMVPKWMPLRFELVYMTGITEWLLALLLIFPQTRRAAGFATVAFLIIILPANLYAAFKGIPAPWSEEPDLTFSRLRPLLYPLLIWWILVVSKHPNHY